MPRVPRTFGPPAYHIAVGLILLAGILGSVLSFRELRRNERVQAETNFFRRAAVLHARFVDMLGRYDDALYSLRTAFTLEGGVTPAEFNRIARNLAERSPGVQAFEWVPVVTAANRAKVEADMSREAAGRSVAFTELASNGQLVTAGNRPEYLPIRYVYPYAGNENALGYDLRTGPTYPAIERALGSRQLTLTSQFKLVQEKQGRRGVVMIWPVFRPAPDAPPGNGARADQLVGFVQGVFRVHDMLETIRARTWNPGSILDMLFVDASETDPALRTLYYRPNDDTVPRDPPPTEAAFRQGLVQVSPLPIGGRNWEAFYRPYTGWLEQQGAPLPWVRTAGIMTIASLISGIVLVLGRRAEDVAREVTVRTAELTESRRQIASLLHALPGLAYRCQYDDQLKIVFVSVGAEALTGYPVSDFVGGKVHVRDLIHPDDVARVRTSTRAAMNEHRGFETEYRIAARDGTEKWVLSRGRGVYDANGKLQFLEGLAIDITARKEAEAAKLKLERRMLESQKLESLGLLAGGIAHDFNNILTGILGNASLARLKLADDSPILAHLHKIELASARAADLCQQMLSYSGRSSFLAEPVEISQLVQEILPLLHVSLTGRARLQLNLSPRPAVATADPSQIRQIVMNLVINAADAIGDQVGEIHVTTGVRTFTADFIAAASEGEGLAPGNYVFLEVRDNGCGMAPETVTRIFDPFYTTKFAGRGLGLAAVRGIVHGHEGAIHVASQPGRGSTFTLLLPPSSRPLEASPIPVEPRTRTGCVLVVDDEDQIRDAASELLRSFGFTTIVAQDGNEGLAQFEINPHGFAFVFLDLTMPNLSGEETLSALRGINPGVRVLLVSGYSESARVARLTAAGGLCFLQKPFSRDDLARKLDDLLG